MTNKELISKDSVKIYISAWMTGDTFFNNSHAMVEGVDKLPTFSPEAIIEEMIDELEGLQPENWKLAKKDILQEALSRIRAENIS